jgi:hypothetical protein
MIAVLVAAVLSAQSPQDTALDVPVYHNETFGIALPRPFDDWVFEPATSRGTTTVIFHPRDVSLRDQLWGALVLTTFNRDVPLGQVADQRIQTSWQPTLGPSFALLTRDSISVQGLPAIHVVMGGSIERAVLDVEEYLIARGGDLILLQVRYPRGLPRDSIAAGYQRMMEGLRILGGTTPTTTERAAPPLPRAVLSALAGSPWQATSYDALVRFDAARGRLDVTARMVARNDAFASQDSVALAVLPPGTFDSVALTAHRPVAARGAIARLRLTSPSGPQDEVSLTAYFHIAALRPALRGSGALVEQTWLPLVEAPADSLGQLRRLAHPRLTLRFDLPDSLRAVAPGRLSTEVVSAGRRRMTWVFDDAAPWSVTVAIAPYRAETRQAARLSVRLWHAASDSLAPERVDSLLALLARAWVVYDQMFGPPPTTEIAVVESDAVRASGSPGVVLVGPGLTADRTVVLRDLARRWWGGSILADGPGAFFLLEGVPAWAALAARGVLEGDSVRQRLVREAEAEWRTAKEQRRDRPLVALDPYTVADRELLRAKSASALEAARRAVGDSRFREAIRTLAIENRGGSANVAELLALLGPDGADVLRSYLFGR